MLKKIGLVALSIVTLYLAVLLIAGIYVNHQKKQLQSYIIQQLKDRLSGDASIRDLDISVWKKFPFIAVTLSDFSLKDSVYHTPVLSAKAVSSTFNLFQAFFSGKTIRNIHIENGLLHVFTDSTGYSNAYLLAKKNKTTIPQTGERTGGDLNIDRLSVHALAIVIENSIKDKEISFAVDRLTASIMQSGNIANIHMYESVTMKKGLGFNLVKGAWLENQTVEANWDILYDLDAKKISFGNTKVKINAQPFDLSGYFLFDKASPSFSIELASKKLDYAAAKKIVTSAIRQKLDRYDLQQPLDVAGTIAGSLLAAHDPIVDIRASTKNNTLHTSFADLGQCSFSGYFMNRADNALEQSDHNSIIRFDGFSADWEGIPITAKTIAITRLDSPFLKVDLHADASLQALDNKLALKEMALNKGKAIFDLSYDGPINDQGPSVEKVQGTIAIQDASVNYIPRDFNFENCNGIINLFRDSISMRGFTCNFKKNQFTVNIDGSNIRGKLMGADTVGQSVIVCSVKSPAVDLGDFTGLFGDRHSRSKNMSPEKQFSQLSKSLGSFIGNSIIDITMQAGKIKNQQLTATNFDTRIRFETNRWILSHILMNIAGGSISAKGNVTKTTGNNTAAVKVVINHADIKKLMYAFDNFGQQAVTNENLSGNFMTVADLQLGISTAGHVVPASLRGSVDFSLKNGSLQRFAPFDRLKTFVFKKRDLDNVQFAEMKDRFDIKGSAIYVNRMEVQSTAFRLFLEGNYDFYKKTTDLLIQVPFSNLNGNSFEGDSTLTNKGTSNRRLGNIWLRAVNEDDGKIKVKLTLNRKVLKGKAA